MAPVATNENESGNVDRIAELKKQTNGESKLVNPFYSPTADSASDDTYEYAVYKVSGNTVELDFRTDNV
jgi:sulfonate dioxygenase